MKIKLQLILWILILSACGPAQGAQNPAPEAAVTPSLPSPKISITSVPDPNQAVTLFLDGWKASDYNAMYALLTETSRAAITPEQFAQLYQDTAVNLTLQNLDYEISHVLKTMQRAEVIYKITYHTILMKEIQREMTMNLALENDGWKVQWEDGLIMPELRGGRRLALDITVPSRGNIYDDNGNLIVAQSDAYALGVTTGPDLDYQSRWVLPLLRDLTGVPVETIMASYAGQGPGWYVPVGDAPAAEVDRLYYTLAENNAVVLSPYTARYYFDHGVAPQAIGYTMPIPREELDYYRRQGFRLDEKVGMTGLEKSFDNELRGGRGYDLYVVDSQGQVADRLYQVQPTPAKSIYTTLDRNLQIRAQQALGNFLGAIVVIERDTGRVLAMVSSPEFDPNVFEPTNINSNTMLTPLLNNKDKPLLNRAAQGGYPLGSVFKIITMAAALESGLYTASSSYYCGLEFRELPNEVFYDWTYAKEYPESGELTLPEALMRSCNPWFWHIGLDLYRQNMPTKVSDMARSFGLGKPTGIAQIPEDSGSMPNPQNEGDAVQLAIGQGTMLATPLQVANFIAAIGNGGTLYRPQIIEKIVEENGSEVYTFKPEVAGQLPVKPENLDVIRKAMFSVISNKRGTAYEKFIGMKIAMYGKTGTAQNPFGDAHAWFAGYTNMYRTDKPDIAVAVIAENAGEGSEIAAPIFRRIVEIYFEGRPKTLYPWEMYIGVPYTPTPLYPPTPTSPPPTRTPEEATVGAETPVP